MIDQASLASFKNKAIRCLQKAEGISSWLREPGDIIQCSPSALSSSARCKNRICIMGFNPGGSSGDALCITTKKLGQASSSGAPIRDSHEPYWRNLFKLVNELNLPPKQEESLFITNLFPNCSASIKVWKHAERRPNSAYVDAIWPLHELMLSIVQPRFIIVSGMGPQSAFKLLWRKLGSQTEWNGTMSPHTKALDPQVKSFSVDDLSVRDRDPLPRVTFIGIKHFSWGGPRIPGVVKVLIDAELREHA